MPQTLFYNFVYSRKYNLFDTVPLATQDLAILRHCKRPILHNCLQTTILLKLIALSSLTQSENLATAPSTCILGYQ